MIYELTVAPSIEPVTLDELKEHARVDGSSDDAYLTALITAARELVERTTGRCLISQTWRLTMDRWPNEQCNEWWDGVRELPITNLEASWVELRKSPILAITSVVTKDEADTETTWASTNYYLGKSPNGFGRLVRKSGAVWPVLDQRAAGAIEITFTAGYGTLAASVPYALRHAVKMLALHWYEKREPASDCASQQLMPMGLGAIVSSYRVMR